jgi:hypothetical protein
MSTMTLIETTCAHCAETMRDEAPAVMLGDLRFHRECVPQCEMCGRGLARELEADWTFQAEVISSVYGYERVPSHHVCAACRASGLFAEPSPQD